MLIFRYIIVYLQYMKSSIFWQNITILQEFESNGEELHFEALFTNDLDLSASFCRFYYILILIAVHMKRDDYHVPDSSSDVVAVAFNLARDMCNLLHESPSGEDGDTSSSFHPFVGIASATSLTLCKIIMFKVPKSISNQKFKIILK